MFYVTDVTGVRLTFTRKAVEEFLRKYTANPNTAILEVQLNGQAVRAHCIGELTDDTYVMETPPLGPDLDARHYFTVRQVDGHWRHGVVVVGTDRGGRLPQDRLKSVREYFH